MARPSREGVTVRAGLGQQIGPSPLLNGARRALPLICPELFRCCRTYRGPPSRRWRSGGAPIATPVVTTETRPLIAADPMLRAPSPEKVEESTFAGGPAAAFIAGAGCFAAGAAAAVAAGTAIGCGITRTVDWLHSA